MEPTEIARPEVAGAVGSRRGAFSRRLGALEREPRPKVVAGHALFGRDIQALARRNDSRRRAVRRGQPQTVRGGSSDVRARNSPRLASHDRVRDFVEECMVPDHREFADEDVD